MLAIMDKSVSCKNMRFGRAGCPQPAAAAWGHAALPDCTNALRISEDINHED